MEWEDVDTRHAYDRIREAIVTLDLAPGALVDDQALSRTLDISAVAVREALKLLAHDGLVEITPRHGFYVADISLEDLAQISEARLTLEPLCAGLAAERASPDDLAVLDALGREQAATPPDDGKRWLDMDHRFHQAIVRAAKNRHLARILEHLFGLSQRLWYLVLPRLDALPVSVSQHLELTAAIERRDADAARRIMHGHVKSFYDQVRRVLDTQGTEG